eukprot:1176335-Prorocentrum_minimum.AAC.1
MIQHASWWCNQTRDARVYSHDGPIRRRKRGYILTTDQSDKESTVCELALDHQPRMPQPRRQLPCSHHARGPRQGTQRTPPQSANQQLPAALRAVGARGVRQLGVGDSALAWAIHSWCGRFTIGVGNLPLVRAIHSWCGRFTASAGDLYWCGKFAAGVGDSPLMRAIHRWCGQFVSLAWAIHSPCGSHSSSGWFSLASTNSLSWISSLRAECTLARSFSAARLACSSASAGDPAACN